MCVISIEFTNFIKIIVYAPNFWNSPDLLLVFFRMYYLPARVLSVTDYHKSSGVKGVKR